MKIQESVKTIDDVSNCVWNYDNFSLDVFVNHEGFQNRIFIQGQIQDIIGTNLIRNIETINFIETL